MNIFRTHAIRHINCVNKINNSRAFSSTRENWLKIFDNFAVQRKGFINAAEFRRMLSVVEYGDGSVKKYEALFNEVDVNKDGFIKKDTFNSCLIDILTADRAEKLNNILKTEYRAEYNNKLQFAV